MRDDRPLRHPSRVEEDDWVHIGVPRGNHRRGARVRLLARVAYEVKELKWASERVPFFMKRLCRIVVYYIDSMVC